MVPKPGKRKLQDYIENKRLETGDDSKWKGEQGLSVYPKDATTEREMNGMLTTEHLAA